jgi:Acyl CoA:acetate/3-ketoacid CoA transferase, alpha subunit
MAELLELDEAVRELVNDGDSVALEGFTHLIPFSAGHELIRQGKRDLTLIRMTPDLIYDQMIGMGCARKMIFSWGGNPGVGSLHRLRDAVENDWPRRSRRSTATPGWRTATRPAPPTCLSRSCAGTWAPS